MARRSNKHSNKKKDSGEFSGILKTSLTFARSLCSALPTSVPASIFDTALTTINEIEMTMNNEEDEAMFLQNVKRISDVIRRSFDELDSTNLPPDLQCQIESLTNDLQEISSECADAPRSGFKRFMQREHDARSLSIVARKLKNALEIFNMDCNIRIRKDVYELKKQQQDDGLKDKLQPVLTARHDSIGASTVKDCMEGTRVALLQDIETWIESDGRVFWLNGMAGLGKSTIAKSVAQMASLKKLLGASFFFSARRSADAQLHDPNIVYRTIAYQLCRHRASLYNAFVSGLEEDPDWTSSELTHQAEHFNSTLRNCPEIPSLPIIVLDAMDECDEPGSIVLLGLLLSAVLDKDSPIPLRIFITSRPETRIASVFSKYKEAKQVILHSIEDSIVESDIRLYLHSSLSRVPEVMNLDLLSTWFSEDDVIALSERAGKFFIYASTALRYIEDDQVNNPKVQLEELLRTSYVDGAALTDLDDLYLGILQRKSKSKNAAQVSKQFMSVVGSLLFLKDILSIRDLELLLGETQGLARSTMSTLSSVILLPNLDTEPARFYHPSFYDFITSRERCVDPMFHIVSKERQRHLAIRCLSTMIHDLDFQDENLKSLPKNEPVPEINNRITKHLTYACIHWISHLLEADPTDPETISLLTTFVYQHFLRWIEVLISISQLPVASRHLGKVKVWAKNLQDQDELLELLNDVDRFVGAFQAVLMAGREHIYLSALPFCPQKTRFWVEYGRFASEKIRVRYNARETWLPCSKVIKSDTFSFPRPARVIPTQRYGPILQVAFSPDNQKAAILQQGGCIRVWDIASGCTLTTCERLAENSYFTNECLIFTPDGSTLAVLKIVTRGSQRTRYLSSFEVETGTPLPDREISPKDATEYCAIISPNLDVAMLKLEGVTIFCSSTNETSPPSHPKEIDILERGTIGMPPALALQLAAYSSSGALLAYIYGDFAVIRSATPPTDNVDERTTLIRLGTQDSKISWLARNCVLFSPDERQVITCSCDGDVSFWDVKTGALMQSLKLHDGLFDDPNLFDGIKFPRFRNRLSLCISPDNSKLAFRIKSTIFLWDIKSDDLILRSSYHTEMIRNTAISPDGRFLASVGGNGLFCVWDTSVTCVESSTQLPGFQIFKKSSDERKVAISSMNRVWIWNNTSSLSYVDCEGVMESQVSHLIWSKTNAKLAAITHAGVLSIWDGNTGVRVATRALFIPPKYPRCNMAILVEFSPDESFLALALRDSCLIIDSTTAAELQSIPFDKSTLSYRAPNLPNLIFTPDSSGIFICLDQVACGFRLGQENSAFKTYSYGEPRQIGSSPSVFKPSLNGTCLLFEGLGFQGGTKRTLVWNVDSGNLITEELESWETDWRHTRFAIDVPKTGTPNNQVANTIPIQHTARSKLILPANFVEQRQIRLADSTLFINSDQITVVDFLK